MPRMRVISSSDDSEDANPKANPKKVRAKPSDGAAAVSSPVDEGDRPTKSQGKSRSGVVKKPKKAESVSGDVRKPKKAAVSQTTTLVSLWGAQPASPAKPKTKTASTNAEVCAGFFKSAKPAKPMRTEDAHDAPPSQNAEVTKTPTTFLAKKADLSPDTGTVGKQTPHATASQMKTGSTPAKERKRTARPIANTPKRLRTVEPGSGSSRAEPLFDKSSESPPSSGKPARWESPSTKDNKVRRSIKKESPKNLPKSKAKAKAGKRTTRRSQDEGLEGAAVVFSGVFTEPRGVLEDIAKQAGMVLRTGVSGLTEFLIIGHALQEDDPKPVTEGSKYRKAMELAPKGVIQILTEPEFRTRLGVKAVSSPDAAPKESAPVVSNESSTLWSEKYRPNKRQELVGNDHVVKKLYEWLRDWRTVVLEGHKKPAPPPKYMPGQAWPEPERVNSPAALLSGPPGVGKTTAARVVAEELGYVVREFNASDARGKQVIEYLSQMTKSGGNLDRWSTSNKEVGFQGVCVVFDEVDGLSAGDRGGGQAMGKLIDVTKCPVICICNDRMSQKVRSLASKCYDLRFSRPTFQQMMCRLSGIAMNEQLSVTQATLDSLANNAGFDIRQVLNAMQFMQKEGGRGSSSKDSGLMVTPFDAVKTLLTESAASKLSLNQKTDLFFTDYDQVGLIMQDSYLRAMPSTRSADQNLKRSSWAADCFSYGDLLNTKVYSSQRWDLMPSVVTFSGLSVASAVR
ncbi:MAG: uncharacterized protein KVP18_003899 [Porospora cf. gigantea A]|uniref:uncharacterized protein n=1 Tax=Porospora cf. gigantea A TaxID=2853593 RepID=UPI0035594D46|nr:MAG: hypothetical protein KVP18_003899 [Porospora cf. gigantea A]